MIDSDDAGDAMFAALIAGGPAGLVLLVVAIVLWAIASGNEDECAKRACRNGAAAVLMDHECRCVEAPMAGGR